MITFRDACTLAWIKLRTRKGRTIFAAFSASVGIICILAFSFGTQGLVHFVHNVFPVTLQGRYFSIETFNNGATETSVQIQEGTGDQEVVTTPVEPLPEEATNADLYMTNHAGVTHAYPVVMQTNGMFGLQAVSGDTSEEIKNHNGVASYTEPLFVSDVLAPGYSFDKLIDGKIPVIISDRWYLSEDMQFAVFGDKAREHYEKNQELRKPTIGKVFELLNASVEGRPAVGVQVIVVGVVSDTGIFRNPFVGSDLVFPVWAAQDNAFLHADATNVQDVHAMVAEFADKQARDDFAQGAFMRTSDGSFAEAPHSFVNSAIPPSEQIDEFAKFLRRVGYGIGGFFLAISSIVIMTTLGKIVADSQKEIAVFRAVGAHKNDIRTIYYSYVFLLTTGSFVIGTVIAIVLDIVASTRWGDSLFYGFANASTSGVVERPLFVLFGFAPSTWIAVYGITVLCGIIAATIPVFRASRIKPVQVLREL